MRFAIKAFQKTIRYKRVWLVASKDADFGVKCR